MFSPAAFSFSRRHERFDLLASSYQPKRRRFARQRFKYTRDRIGIRLITTQLPRSLFSDFAGKM